MFVPEHAHESLATDRLTGRRRTVARFPDGRVVIHEDNYRSTDTAFVTLEPPHGSDAQTSVKALSLFCAACRLLAMGQRGDVSGCASMWTVPHM